MADEGGDVNLAQRIRQAALGPTPQPSSLRINWLDSESFFALSKPNVLGRGWGLEKGGGWGSASITEKRMFLLMVAEAVADVEAARTK